jgi:endoglucanase
MKTEGPVHGPASIRAACLFAAALLGALAASAAAADWDAYRQRFVAPDGRVRDHAQNAISHSEGQGYGLLLALLQDDRRSFDSILRWTKDNLQVRRDALLAWSWGKRPNGDWNVIDYNNASDGDALVAYALARAADRWPQSSYRDAALRIIGDMRRHLAVVCGDYQLVAPAYYGFSENGGNVFNTGYLVLPAYAHFARIEDRAFWQRTLDDSRRLLERSAFSRFGLPADWVAFEDGRPTVHGPRSPFFGYEAIRVPLYLIWSGNDERLGAFRAYLEFVERSGYLPRRVNLIDGTVALEEAPAGFYAVMAAGAERLGMRSASQMLSRAAAAKIANEPDDYFSHSLYLLAGGRLD